MPAPKGNQYAKGCKTNGAPCTFKEEYVEAVDKYIQLTDKDKIHPTMAGFSAFINTPKRTVVQWLEDNRSKDFSLAIGKLKNKSEQYLIEKGLSGKYNSAMARFLLNANYGHVEKRSIDADIKGDHKVEVYWSGQDES